ncbi:MAG: hypothetical protein J6A59_08455 [Lachnospiraceae bacterium]|nr:hypothetical protein [Lachnospiraceae bacterium]
MQADYIQDIVGKFEELPYECILFDGVWGIGKTYAINEALKEKENVCRISLFGLQNSQQIYHEVLFQSTLKNSKAGKVGEFASDVLSGISSIWESAAQAKDVIQNVAREKELFLLLSKSFKTLHIIVIDDLERISDIIKMEEVLGIVEELKRCSYVKVILVANTKELKGDNEDVFKKYNEKVIDRVYHITERPQKINWGDIGIHAGFMQEFLMAHKVKNLRTLQKAQKFYDDVKLYCGGIDNEQFLDEIRLICFAIVVEITDALYYRELSEEELKRDGGTVAVLRNNLEHRILNYLGSIKCRRNLVVMLLKYYEEACGLTSADMQIEYDIFIQAGKKPNFYKNDAEIKQILPGLIAKMNIAESLGELNRLADEIVIWNDILEEDSSEILKKYKDKLHTMLWNVVMDGHEEILGYSYDMWHTSSEKVKQVYVKERELIRKLLIKEYVEYLSKTTKGEKAFQYSYKLREYFNNTYYRTIIRELAVDLYNRKSFPVDDIDVRQYDTCYNIMYVLYHCDEEKFLAYCEELSEKCDKMSAYRLETRMQDVIKGY